MNVATADFTDLDLPQVTQEMRRRSLDDCCADRAAFERFAYDLWATLDYSAGSKRVDELIVHTVIEHKEKVAAAASQEKKWSSPADYGWPASAPMMVLDLTRIGHDGQGSSRRNRHRELGRSGNTRPTVRCHLHGQPRLHWQLGPEHQPLNDSGFGRHLTGQDDRTHRGGPRDIRRRYSLSVVDIRAKTDPISRPAREVP
jgi:hypothetical protein